MTFGQWLRRYTSIFRRTGIDEAADEAMVLLCHGLKISRSRALAQPERMMTIEELALLEVLADRRLRREPSAYILKQKEFYGLDIFVDQRVLIPRPETEILVEEGIRLSLARAGRNNESITIVDVGTGSGAIAIALAMHVPGALVYAADISAAALDVAVMNIERYGLNKRVIPVNSDLLEQINCRPDIIVANLPYIPAGEMLQLQPEISGYEPEMALHGGLTGTEVIVRLLGQVPGKIKRNGVVLLEIGAGQEHDIIHVIGRCLPGSLVTLIKDLSCTDRVIKIEAN